MTARQPLPWHEGHWHAVATAMSQGRIAHAMLLVGPHGVGKRYFASVLAQSILCSQPGSLGLACGKCRSCQLMQAGTHPDLFRLEKEEGSKVVKVDDLREFNRKIFLTPQLGHGVVGIIDPVDGLNASSANALLKSLEEPPRGVHILLVGERWLGLPATIRSRCVMLRFALPPTEQVTAWLASAPHEVAHTESLRDRYQPDASQVQAWQADLTGVCLGKQDPIAVAERWLKLESELPRIIDWLFGCTSELIKLNLGMHGSGPGGNPGSSDSMRALASRLTPQALQLLPALCVETRALLQTQAKPQLLLENLLASWYQGTRPGA